MPVILAILCAFTLFTRPVSAAKISLDRFRVAPVVLPREGAFILRARARTEGVRLGSFLLRTATEVKREATIPGLPLYANGEYYAAEAGQYFLKDNGPNDGDPETGGFSLTISTRGWKEGRYTFAFFASNRPAPGELVTARHDFAVRVERKRVVVEDLGDADPGSSRAIAAFTARPLAVRPGEPVRLTVRGAGITSVQITNPYFIAPKETLPGFRYLPEQKKSVCSAPAKKNVTDTGSKAPNSPADSFSLTLDTRGWPTGVHHLQLNAIGYTGKPVDRRNFAVQVRAPKDRYIVRVEPSRFFLPGSHFGRFIALPDGAILAADRRSVDGGRAWSAGTGGFGNGGIRLRDGSVLGLGYESIPILGRSGWYAADRFLSTDDGRHFQQTRAEFFVPQAKAAMGHGAHPGPLFMGSLVQRRDGSLAALMAGWFQGDDTPCPYGHGRPYSRCYLCESDDMGKTWRYVSTITAAHIGSEGGNEGTLRCLPNGEWLAILRTGNPSDSKCQDNPLIACVSKDEGRTWSAPRRIGLSGVYPNLLVLENGLLALSYGRPGAMLAFSSDNGRSWHDITSVDATPYSGYTGIARVAPGVILYGFGAQGYLDPASGRREDQLRLAQIRWTPIAKGVQSGRKK